MSSASSVSRGSSYRRALMVLISPAALLMASRCPRTPSNRRIQAGLVLHFLHDALRPDDHVPDALTGNARVFRDFRKGQVLIIVEIEEFLLPVCQEFS